VVVDESGNHEPALQVDAFRIARSVREDAFAGAGGRDAVPFDGHGLDEARLFISGPDPAVDEDHVCGDQGGHEDQAHVMVSPTGARVPGIVMPLTARIANAVDW